MCVHSSEERCYHDDFEVSRRGGERGGGERGDSFVGQEHAGYCSQDPRERTEVLSLLALLVRKYKD